MGINENLDRIFSILLSLAALAILVSAGAAMGFLAGVAGMLGLWGIGVSAGKSVIFGTTLFVALIAVLAGVKYCNTVYWSDIKLR
ncbi:MAG TPA: hypothetical protein PLZ55_02695 [bacterium]|nr:hypothetical protein [bacterium]HPO07550.1 hypothetical protein [bacterium]HQO33352.1 hypothetical protein [bacterium]HQP98725.1 hypothetical protein [bacterium]